MFFIYIFVYCFRFACLALVLYLILDSIIFIEGFLGFFRVTRNKLKRRMREAYRLNKQCLVTCENIYFFIGYIYVGSGEP